MKNFLELFLVLVDALLSAKLAPADFKASYMSLWRQCRDEGGLEALNAKSYDAFDRFFTASDAYCEDPALRDVGDLDDQQLIDAVKTIMADVPR
jgi:hypothetical protein